jgi:hypothetical protein
MSVEQRDRVRAAGRRRAYRTTDATTVVMNSVELAEMDTDHAALDELLYQTRRRSLDANTISKTAAEEHFTDRTR